MPSCVGDRCLRGFPAAIGSPALSISLRRKTQSPPPRDQDDAGRCAFVPLSKMPANMWSPRAWRLTPVELGYVGALCLPLSAPRGKGAGGELCLTAGRRGSISKLGRARIW